MCQRGACACYQAITSLCIYRERERRSAHITSWPSRLCMRGGSRKSVLCTRPNCGCQHGLV
ncbi:unnamed protein product [Scytosiphon promiscuus]